MFYLIDEKDGFFEEPMLVNTLNLQFIEVRTNKSDKEDLTLVFGQNNEEFFLSFNSNNIFNINKMIDNMIRLKPDTFTSPLISLTDQDNIVNFTNRYSSNSPLLHKATKILMNIENIKLAYLKDGKYILNTTYKNFKISESPLEIYNIIQEKIMNKSKLEPALVMSIENKLELRNRL